MAISFFSVENEKTKSFKSMKKSRLPAQYLVAMIKFSCYHLFIVMLTFGVSLAGNTYSQETLARSVTLQMENQDFRDVLTAIEKNTRVKFSYDIAIVPREKLNLRAHTEPLSSVLDKFLAPLRLTYTVAGKYIIITRAAGGSEAGLLPLLYERPGSILQEMVRGRVTDERGEGLPGVSVVVKNTQQGTVTNANGEFSQTVPDGNAILVFSFEGYTTREVALGNKTQVDISLSVDEKSLDEVMVIGYGTAKKSDLTGAVTRVNADVFRSQALTQVTDMLAGNVAGFYANQSPNAVGGSSMEIRGPSSISASTSPLIVLDGVIYNGSIRDINPTDIETIDILKDASSAAVFGSKAASGVIIITTVKGKTGKPRINFSTKLGVTEATNRSFGSYDAKGYLNFRRDMFRFMRGPLPDFYYFSPDELPEGVTLDQWRAASANPHEDNTTEWLNRLNFFPIEIENYKAGKTINWMDEVVGKGFRQDYDVSIGGGAEALRYYWSIGYTNNEGIIKGDQFGTIRSRLNIDFDVSEWLKVGMNTQFANRDESVVQANLGTMYTASPYGSMRNPDGSIRWYPGDYIGVVNPLLDYYGQDRLKKVQSLFSAMFAEIKLPFGITHRVSYQPRYEMWKDYNYWSPETVTGGQNYPDGRASREDFSQFAWMLDNLLKWNKDFGVHNFDLTLLHNLERNRTWNSVNTNITFMPSPILGYHGMQFGTNPSVYSNDTEASGNALMARLNYSLMGRYLLTASIRKDGFSAFGQRNPTANFPALAVAWNISEEPFFKVNWVNQLKVRASWGLNGNRDIGIYSALAQLGSNLYYNGSNVQVGLFNNTLGNRELRWEQTESLNLGLDAGVLSNRLSFSADIYRSSTTNLLMSRRLPSITGFSTIMTNLGRLDNKGIELTVNSVNIDRNDFSWRSNLVFSLNRNKIRSLFGDYEEVEIDGRIVRREVPDYSNKWFPGQALDVVWDYDIEGIWQVEEESQAAVYRLVPGDFKARDIDGNGKYEALSDKTFIGYSQPRYRLGLRNDFNFLKNFSASFFIRADLGHIASMPQALHSWSTYDRNSTSNVPYWTAENRTNEWPRLTQDNAPFGGGIMLYKPRSFVRLQDVSLSYNVPDQFARQVRLKDIRIFASVRNMYSFDKWPGWDPESTHTPMPRTYTFGLNVSL